MKWKERKEMSTGRKAAKGKVVKKKVVKKPQDLTIKETPRLQIDAAGKKWQIEQAEGQLVHGKLKVTAPCGSSAYISRLEWKGLKTACDRLFGLNEKEKEVK